LEKSEKMTTRKKFQKDQKVIYWIRQNSLLILTEAFMGKGKTEKRK
jgi:hypothetical protein